MQRPFRGSGLHRAEKLKKKWIFKNFLRSEIGSNLLDSSDPRSRAGSREVEKENNSYFLKNEKIEKLFLKNNSNNPNNQNDRSINSFRTRTLPSLF
jgi:hypothetical protein